MYRLFIFLLLPFLFVDIGYAQFSGYYPPRNIYGYGDYGYSQYGYEDKGIDYGQSPYGYEDKDVDYGQKGYGYAEPGRDRY